MKPRIWIAAAGSAFCVATVFLLAPEKDPVARSAISQSVQNPPVEAASELSAPASPPPAPGETSVNPRRESNGDPPVTTVSDSSVVTGDDQYRPLREWRVWAVQDPNAALASALRLPRGGERDQILEAICLGLGETQPRKAVDLAMTYHLNQRSGAVVESLVQQWAGTDAPAALAWAANQAPSADRNRFLGRVAFVESQQDPQAAAKIVACQIPSGPERDEAAISVLHQWAEQDPIAAAAWAERFPEERLRERARNELAGMQQERAAAQ